MAWRIESLDDLRAFCGRLKDKGVPIARVADHRISPGIYFRDPAGSGRRWDTADRLDTAFKDAVKTAPSGTEAVGSHRG